MKEKGLVMEINGRNVILLTKDGRFISHRISGLCPQIGDEINIENEKQKGLWFSVSILVAAAVLMIVVFAGKIWNESYMPFMANGVVSYVTIDINPSIELGLDKEGTVVNVVPLNQDCSLLLEGLTLKGLKSEEAVDAFIAAAARKGYLAPEKENQVIISVSEKDKTKDRKISETITEKAEKTLAEKEMQVKIDVINTDFDLREKAEELGISSGKYAILVEAKEAGLNIDTESLKKSGVAKIIEDAGGDIEKIIKSAQDETDFPGKINKWQQQLKDDYQLNKNEEKNSENLLKEVEKIWKKEEKNKATKEKSSQINEQKNTSNKKEKNKKDSSKEVNSSYNKLMRDNILEEINKYKEKYEEKDRNKSKEKGKVKENNKNNGKDNNKDSKKERSKEKSSDNNKEDSKEDNIDKNKDREKDKEKGNQVRNNPPPVWGVIF